MPSPVRAMVSLVTKSWPLLVKYGPQALTAVSVLTKFVTDNPAVPAWFRDRLRDVPKRMNAVQKRHGEAAKIRGTLEIIRDVAQDAHTADARINAADYRSRADRIELGVRLAETQDRQARKIQLGRLKADTDALLAELLESVSGTQPTASGAGGPGDRSTIADESPAADPPAADP